MLILVTENLKLEHVRVSIYIYAYFLRVEQAFFKM